LSVWIPGQLAEGCSAGNGDKGAGRDRGTARATLGKGLACFGVSALRARLALAVVHVSIRPPCHPGRSHLTSPVGDHDCPCAIFPNSPRLKRSLAYTPCATGLPHTSVAARRPIEPAQSPAWATPRPPVMTESPFAPLRCYLSGSRVKHDLGQRYPILIAPTGSCARPRSSVSLCIRSDPQSLQVAVSPCCI
jgi:hypothetical protein